MLDSLKHNYNLLLTKKTMSKIKTIRKISYRSWSGFRPVPFIPIQGVFLKDLGFIFGSKIKVTYEPGKIIITKFNP